MNLGSVYQNRHHKFMPVGEERYGHPHLSLHLFVSSPALFYPATRVRASSCIRIMSKTNAELKYCVISVLVRPC